MAAAAEELSWFAQLGRVAKRAVGVKPAEDGAPLQRSSASAEKAPWRAFELADAMEQGLAQELTTGFMEAPARAEPARHLVVSRSEDRKEHVLMSENGEPLLVARCTEESRIAIYVPTGGDPPLAVGPAFMLTARGPAAWTLTSERCECCEYMAPARACASQGCCRRELAHIRHFREDIGEGSAMCMEVDLPTLRQDNSPAVWCARSCPSEEQDKLHLESRRPKWSEKLQSLTLDFRGRCSRASAKNFQLQTAGAQRGKKEETELLFGKTADNTFVLDYKHPLGMVQAFAIALSTRDWQ